MTITLGIDIGLTGALAAIDSRGTCQVADLPTKPQGDKNRLCGRALLDLMRSFVPPGAIARVVIEDVQARPFGNANTHGNTMHSQASMMRSRGAVESACDIARLELVVVSPQTWKKFYGLTGQPKSASMGLALRLYPDAPLKLVKHHNRAESLLLAHWGARVLEEIAA
jgi:hypothetical protein